MNDGGIIKTGYIPFALFLSVLCWYYFGRISIDFHFIWMHRFGSGFQINFKLNVMEFDGIFWTELHQPIQINLKPKNSKLNSFKFSHCWCVECQYQISKLSHFKINRCDGKCVCLWLLLISTLMPYTSICRIEYFTILCYTVSVAIRKLI